MAQFQLVKTVRFSDTLRVVEKADGRVQTYGISTSETPDGDNEICDYEDAKKQYQIWSEAFERATKAAGQEVSKGNIRIQHGMDMGGKAVEVDYDDGAKTISLRTEAADSDIGSQLKRGLFTGMSHAGSYLYRRCNVCATEVAKGNFCKSCGKQQLIRYAPILAEVSYVDNPCNPDARFTFVKADGTTIQKAFEKANSDDSYSAATLATESKLSEILARLNQIAPALSEKAITADVQKGVLHLVTDADGTKHLPYTGPDGKPDHRLMGAAWAALHGGYRGNKYEGHDKDKALSQLVALYSKEGMETPTAKFTRVVTEAIQKTGTGKLEKGMWEVADVAVIIENIAWVQQSAAWEREWEKDNSTLPEEFLGLLEHAIRVFQQQVTEETSELTEAARAAAAAVEAADAAEKTSKGANGNMADKNTFVKVFAEILGVEKAHGLAHHIGKMARCVKAFHAEGYGLHKSHHAAMIGHLDGIAANAGEGEKAIKAKGHLAKATECAHGHMADGVDMHREHADEMAGHFGKLGKILGVEEADKWADEASDVPEEVGGEPKGGTKNDYDKSRKAATAVPDKDSFSKAEVGELIAATLGEFMKNFSEGISEAVTQEPEPVHKTATGIGDRSQVRFPKSGQGTGGVGKAADTAGQGNGAGAGTGAAVPEPITADDVMKAQRGDTEALRKMGLGGPGEMLPPEVATSMWAMAK